MDYSEGPLEKQKVFEYRGSNCSRKVLVHEPRVYSPLRQRVILIFCTKQNFGEEIQSDSPRQICIETLRILEWESLQR